MNTDFSADLVNTIHITADGDTKYMRRVIVKDFVI